MQDSPTVGYTFSYSNDKTSVYTEHTSLISKPAALGGYSQSAVVICYQKSI